MTPCSFNHHVLLMTSWSTTTHQSIQTTRTINLRCTTDNLTSCNPLLCQRKMGLHTSPVSGCVTATSPTSLMWVCGKSSLDGDSAMLIFRGRLVSSTLPLPSEVYMASIPSHKLTLACKPLRRDLSLYCLPLLATRHHQLYLTLIPAQISTLTCQPVEPDNYHHGSLNTIYSANFLHCLLSTTIWCACCSVRTLCKIGAQAQLHSTLFPSRS